MQYIIVLIASILAVAPTTQDEVTQEYATIKFRVEVPKNTPAGETLYISGNEDALGAWEPDGLALTRNLEGYYEANVKLEVGSKIEFKVTRGTWESVEKGRYGEETGNRVFIVKHDRRVRARVLNWRKEHVVPTLTGDVRDLGEIESDALGYPKHVWVYLPPGYESSDARYPVLYMQSGQDLFDAMIAADGVEWQVDETTERLINAGRVEPLIIVAIGTEKPRLLHEYIPEIDHYEYIDHANETTYAGTGTGNQYAAFVVTELKPYIDKTFRTKPGRDHTGVAGASAGGLISLHMAYEHPDVFGKAAAMSPTLLWGQNSAKRWHEAPQPLAGLRLWFDMGTREGVEFDIEHKVGKAVLRCMELADTAQAVGLEEGKDFRFVEVRKGYHGPGSWAARFGKVLQFLYGTESP